MSLRVKLFGAACALALAGSTAPALADGSNFDGILDGNYSHLDANHGGGTANSWGVDGTGSLGFAPSWAAQISGGYHNVSGGGAHVDLWDVNGAAYWRSASGRIGAVVGYDNASSTGASLDVTNYGAFGDWYATSAITVGVKGGGFSGSHGVNGEYAGASVTGYLHSDFALSGSYDYTHLNHLGNENDWTVQGEWLVSENTPISIYGGYTNSKISGGGPTINTWFAGLRFYCDPTAQTLVDRQRTGAEIWGNSFGPAVLKF